MSAQYSDGETHARYTTTGKIVIDGKGVSRPFVVQKDDILLRGPATVRPYDLPTAFISAKGNLIVRGVAGVHQISLPPVARQDCQTRKLVTGVNPVNYNRVAGWAEEVNKTEARSMDSGDETSDSAQAYTPKCIVIPSAPVNLAILDVPTEEPIPVLPAQKILLSNPSFKGLPTSPAVPDETSPHRENKRRKTLRGSPLFIPTPEFSFNFSLKDAKAFQTRIVQPPPGKSIREVDLDIAVDQKALDDAVDLHVILTPFSPAAVQSLRIVGDLVTSNPSLKEVPIRIDTPPSEAPDAAVDIRAGELSDYAASPPIAESRPQNVVESVASSPSQALQEYETTASDVSQTRTVLDFAHSWPRATSLHPWYST